MVLANIEPDHQDNAFGVDFFNQVSTTEEWPSLGSSLLTSSTSSTTTLRLDSPQQFEMFGMIKSRKSTSPVNRRNINANRLSTQAPSLAETLRQTYGAQNMNIQFNQQLQQQQNQINNQAAKNPKLYKTELCRSWMDSGRCNYGERCQYAHGDTEKRPIPRHPKYKTEACQSYHQSGYCPYGPRCHFIHNEEPNVLAQLVAQNAAAAAASKAQQQQTLQQQHARNQAQLNSSGLQRPSSLFASNVGAARGAAAVGARGQTPSLINNGQKIGTSQSAIAAAAAMAAAAFNQQPQLFSKQFQNQLQMFNDTISTEKRPSKSQIVFGDGSTGDSPIPSSNDSGTESPLGSFSPGFDAANPYGQIGQQVEWSLAENFNELSFNSTPYNNPVAPPPGLQDQQMDMIPLNLLPSSMSSDVESGFLSSASSIASNKSVNSPPMSGTGWSNGVTTTPTAGRLPVFERLSNGP